MYLEIKIQQVMFESVFRDKQATSKVQLMVGLKVRLKYFGDKARYG